jgi:hypothetical protein
MAVTLPCALLVRCLPLALPFPRPLALQQHGLAACTICSTSCGHDCVGPGKVLTHSLRRPCPSLLLTTVRLASAGTEQMAGRQDSEG